MTTRKTTTYQPTQSTTRPTTKRPTAHPSFPSHHTHHTNPSHHTHKPTTTRPFTTVTTTTRTNPTSTTQRQTQTYPTRPSYTPNPTGSGGGNLGVQPPSTRPTTTPNPNLFVPGYQPSFFIIPFPFPFAPTCPCYFVEPTGNHSMQNQQQLQWQQQMQSNQNAQIQWQSQHQYAIGFIPVLFVPHCAPSNLSNQVSGQYLQASYPCAQCNQSPNRNGRELDLNENYSSSDSFRQVLAQAGIDIFSNSLVKSPNRKSRARKLKRIQTAEEPHLNELSHEIQQDPPRDEE